MHLVRWDVDHVPGLNRAVTVLGSRCTLAAEDEDFVFEVVPMVGRAAARFDFEMTHVEIGGAVGWADQHPHSGTDRAFHHDDLLWMSLNRLDLHLGTLPLMPLTPRCLSACRVIQVAGSLSNPLKYSPVSEYWQRHAILSRTIRQSATRK